MRRLGHLGLFVVCGLAAAVACSARAHGISLRDLFRRPPETQQVQRVQQPVAVYTAEDGERFIFDRSAATPLIRFESSPEIWVLKPEAGPRGDIIYKNDVGEPVLRATRLGGLTLFTLDRPAGTAAALDGDASPLGPASILSAFALQQRLIQASVRASRALQRLIVFDAPDVTPDSATEVADVGQVASEAIVSLAKHDLHRVTDKLNKVVLSPGHASGASFKDGVLEVNFIPEKGLAGRPSSRRIAAAVAR